MLGCFQRSCRANTATLLRAERLAIQQQVVRELFDFLQKHVSGGAFNEVCTALAEYGNEEIDDRTLPCPG